MSDIIIAIAEVIEAIGEAVKSIQDYIDEKQQRRVCGQPALKPLFLLQNTNLRKNALQELYRIQMIDLL